MPDIEFQSTLPIRGATAKTAKMIGYFWEKQTTFATIISRPFLKLENTTVCPAEKAANFGAKSRRFSGY